MGIRMWLIALIVLAASPALADRHLTTRYVHLPETYASAAPLAPPTGDAVYGVQRTQRSQRALWRDSGCIDFAIDAGSVTPEIAAVIDAAFATWSTATRTCGAVSFATHREPHAAAITHDGVDAIVVRADRWCRPASASEPEQCYPPEVAAMTRLVFIDDPSDEEDGLILEADMELNAVNFELLLPGQAPPASGKSSIDLLSVVTHEAGHVLGLAHNCGVDPTAWPTDHRGRQVPACSGAASIVTAATMFYMIDAGDTAARTLKPGDVTGACAMARGLECTRDVEGGCSAGGSPAWLVALLVLCTLLGRARSCARRSQRAVRA